MDQLALVSRILVLLMGRFPNKRVEATFVFGRAKRDYEVTEGDSGILEAAAEIYGLGKTGSIVVPGTKGGETHHAGTVTTTYPGPEAWAADLEKLGVLKDNIFITAPGEVHTRGDSDSFVHFCKQRSWQRAAVITQPHQMLRAMLALLESFKLHQYPMSVMPVCPQRVNWKKLVYGSQGEKLLTREQHEREEFQRTLEQQSKGWLASFEELEVYLKNLQ